MGKSKANLTDSSAASAARSYAFGPFVLIPEQQLLMEGPTPVRLGSRAFEILAALVERSGKLVRKDELLARAWPDTFVDDSNLKVSIAALRRTLGERPDGARYIATVKGRGYQFTAPIRLLERSASSRDAPAALPRVHNLPIAATHILGRADDIDAVLGQLEESRFVTIVGPGGIGKTRVALAVAERMIATVEYGAWFVDLALLSDPTLVPGAIATALGLKVHSANIYVALSAFLRERPLLLVLDNCEHLIDAVAFCAERILAGAASVRILATSREPLRARGEQIYRLLPLETPADSRSLKAADVLAFAAVELFVERATASFSGFSLNDADAPVVAEICRRLDGMALAIELAATRVDAFGVREILGLLGDRFRLLKGWRTAPDRHQTLTAALDWSYDLLTESERSLLRRLSVFAGIFGLESAFAVAGDEKLGPIRLTADLANLVAKSLVCAERGQIATLYRLLDTTRNYAFLKLLEKGEFDRCRRRHAEHLRDLAERNGKHDRRPNGSPTMGAGSTTSVAP
jgi:predicted ATPase/DNA-binding winged helix-turn-helix (wHTH) protein